MRHGIVEGEPGSMPWGQWWLRKLIRHRLRGKPRDQRPEAEPGRAGSERVSGESEGKGEGSATT